MLMARHRSMPSLADAQWLDTAPLTPDDLKGHVVVVDFWTLTCINWLRTEPYVRAWSEAYRADGLVVVGVHTPEFSFEHDVDRIRLAVQERSIDYPVVVDSDYGVWTAFDNHYWPALYFVDDSGVIRDEHFGEGRYEESERVIQELLGVRRPLVEVQGTGVEAEADWDHLRTPESYLGYGRGERFASPGDVEADRPQEFALPADLPLNGWALSGEWTIGAEAVVSGKPGASVVFRFQARDAHLVLSHGSDAPIPFRVLLDGAPPADAHGEDVDPEGNGVLDHGRLYQLVRQSGDIRARTLTVTFADAGAEAYVFTFG
jgi:thiol-disulfide isomerase/thioredoxin